MVGDCGGLGASDGEQKVGVVRVRVLFQTSERNREPGRKG